MRVNVADPSLWVVSDRDPFDLDQLQLDDDLRRSVGQLVFEEEDQDIVWLMSGPRGRRIVRRLLDRSAVFCTSFHPNAMTMAQQEGAKQVGYWLLGEIERLTPSDYTRMMQEGKK